MKQWPHISYINIVNYLIFSECFGCRELCSYKSTEAYNYLHSNTIGKVLLKKHSELIFLEAAVAPSHSVNQAKHTVWIMLKESEVIETGGCSCIAGLWKSCSHAAATLWKIFINPNISSLKAASYASLCSSFLSMVCRQPHVHAQGMDMCVEVVDVLHKTFLKKTFNFQPTTWAHFKNNSAFMT